MYTQNETGQVFTLSKFFFIEFQTCQRTNSLELLHESAMVGNVLPEALEDGADMVPNSELIVELTGGTSVLNI